MLYMYLQQSQAYIYNLFLSLSIYISMDIMSAAPTHIYIYIYICSNPYITRTLPRDPDKNCFFQIVYGPCIGSLVCLKRGRFRPSGSAATCTHVDIHVCIYIYI